MTRTAFVAVLLLALFGACSIESPTDTRRPQPGTRTFAMGFTDFPYANSFNALLETYAAIERDGDMTVMHFDDGVPWQEALDGIAYDPNYLGTLTAKASMIPAGHVVYLAVTPIAFSRDRLADYRGATGSEPLPPPWDERSFDHPEVITAFTNHCENMISLFSPDYFAYAIEANMLIQLAPNSWDAFVALAETVYTNLKTNYPDLPICISLQVQSYYSDPTSQKAGFQQVLHYTDIIALSSYPFSQETNLELIPSNYPAELANLAPGKPFAIAETAWPAEDVTAPYPVDIPADEDRQRLYMEWLLSESLRSSAQFVCWFFTRDYDQMWESDLQYHPDAALLRLWKDTGLYDGQGNARSALSAWRKVLAYERQ